MAIADRLDSLLGIFAIGQKPSGVKDPYALRRAALSVCRIILSAELVLDVPQLLQQAAAQFDKQLNVTAVVDEVAAFIFERLRAYYLSGDNTELPITPQHFDAVLSQRPRQIVDFHRRLLGLVAFSRLPAADSLAAANKRIHNLLRKVEGALPEQLNPQLFQEAAERDLNAALDRIEAEATPYLQAGDYVRALEIMAALKPSVDGFFDAVMVMAEELPVRQNRLALLQRVSNVFLQVADLSLLPGGND